ncbi:MAG: ATP-binding protein [Thermodesulfobacteriota bacterium]
MISRTPGRSILTTLPPWIFIGAAAILFPIFAFITFQNINREKESSSRLLLEKGAALIRSFEAGTRTGMMGMQWDGFGLQRLLTETARQQDILYLLVTDTSGKILAHNNPVYIGQIHGAGLDLIQIHQIEAVQNRVVTTSANKKIFEVFRKFSPSGGRFGMNRGRMMFHRFFERPGEELREISSMETIIFVGLDMSAVEEASQADTRHTVIMGIILLLIGFSGIVLLFLAQNYHATKSSLSRIKAFSDHLVENMPIGLIATDTKGQIASMNQVAISILNLSSGNHVGKAAAEILPCEIGNLVSNPDEQNVNTEIEMNCTRIDGKSIPLQIISSPLIGESNRFLGQIMLLKDLTEVRALEQEVARSRRLAAVGRLAAGVAHEIRNPLSSIKGFATYFKERYREKSEDKHISDIMIQEVDRLNKVVGQLLDFSRPVTIIKKSVDARSFIENSLRIIEAQAKEKGISTVIDGSPEIKNLWVDPDRISQVLLNLYLNAIEAMDKGGTLSILISQSPDSDEAEIRISDTGAGILAENLEHIFDPYFTTKASGTGLGLAIVHNILEAHGGEINVQSRWGEGTTVSIRFPNRERADGS